MFALRLDALRHRERAKRRPKHAAVLTEDDLSADWTERCPALFGTPEELAIGEQQLLLEELNER